MATQSAAARPLSTFDATDLVHDEIRQIVADAVSSGEVIRVRALAARLKASYAGSSLTESEIADELLLAGSTAKVPMEI